MDVFGYFANFMNYLSGFPWDSIVFVLKILSIVISGLALWWYLTAIVRTLEVYAPRPEAPIDSDKQAEFQEIVAKPWLEIQEKMASLNPADWGLAIIQADAVLDKILKASGYIGDTMGDRLRQVNSAELNSIEDVWRSHKIRNRLAHGTEGAIPRSEAEYAMRGYEKAFKELNYI